MLRMKAFFLCLLSIIITDLCSARSSPGGGSHGGGSHGGGSGSGSGSSSSSSSPSTGSTIAAVVVSIVGGTFLLFIVTFCILKKCSKKPRKRVLPLSTQTALAQQGNQYAPPSYNHVPPYGHSSPYSQPPPYEQPPPYSTPSAPVEATN